LLPNETVEKLFFGSILPSQQLLGRPGPRFEDAKTDGFPNQGSMERPERLDLADVVHQGEPRTQALLVLLALIFLRLIP
jgi:hypothetical protein